MKITLDDEDRKWYLQHVHQQCKLTSQLIEDRRWTEIERLLLGLAGSAASFGFSDLGDMAETGRQAAKHEHGGRLQQALSQIQDALLRYKRDGFCSQNTTGIESHQGT